MSYEDRTKAWNEHVGKNWEHWARPWWVELVAFLFGRSFSLWLWRFVTTELSESGHAQYEPNLIEDVDSPWLLEKARQTVCPYCFKQATIVRGPHIITNKGPRGRVPAVTVKCETAGCPHEGGIWHVE